MPKKRYYRLIKLDGVAIESITIMDTPSENTTRKLASLKRDGMEYAFQNDPSVKVFIGNEAAQEGLTLTAAHHVVDIEPEWVPGMNDQKHDRYHRITQTEKVLIHLLVVEGSLDAKILGSAAGKAEDIEKILGG